MQQLNRTDLGLPVYPVKVLQFGGGNFLRGFVDYLIDRYNKACQADIGIAVIKVTPRGDYKQWKSQNGLYHVRNKGLQQGKMLDQTELISSVSTILHAYQEWDQFLETAHDPNIKFIISNTTESGLKISEHDRKDGTPPDSFPAKLTCWLYQRFLHFKGAKSAACTFIPCELLIDNGLLLKELILTTGLRWELDPTFLTWIETEQTFCNTLVDRIVPGIQQAALPAVWEEIGYEDQMATEGEPYHLWAIEGPDHIKASFPLDQAGLNVVFTPDLQPFRKRKVRILNGAHTALVPVAYLLGLRIVRDSVNDEVAGAFLTKLLAEEILPVMNMPMEEVTSYADTVIERFKNPYIDHYLISIALNSLSKFTSRLMPSVRDYMATNDTAPCLITCSLACIILMYRGSYNGETIPLKDDPVVLQKLAGLWQEYAEVPQQLAQTALSWEAGWGIDLSKDPKIVDAVTHHLTSIQQNGIDKHIKSLL